MLKIRLRNVKLSGIDLALIAHVVVMADVADVVVDAVADEDGDAAVVDSGDGEGVADVADAGDMADGEVGIIILALVVLSLKKNPNLSMKRKISHLWVVTQRPQ